MLVDRVNTGISIVLEMLIFINIIILLKRKPKIVKGKYLFYFLWAVVIAEFIGLMEVFIHYRASIEEGVFFSLLCFTIPLYILISKKFDLLFYNFNTKNLYETLSNILKEKDIFFDTIFDGNFKYKINIPQYDSAIKIWGSKESSCLRIIGKERKKVFKDIENQLEEDISKVDNKNIAFREILCSIILLVAFSWTILCQIIN